MFWIPGTFRDLLFHYKAAQSHLASEIRCSLIFNVDLPRRDSNNTANPVIGSAHEYLFTGTTFCKHFWMVNLTLIMTAAAIICARSAIIFDTFRAKVTRSVHTYFLLQRRCCEDSSEVCKTTVLWAGHSLRIFEQTCQKYEETFFQHNLQPTCYISDLQLGLNLCFLEYKWGWYWSVMPLNR